MRTLSREQEKVLDLLLRVADGDVSLVEQALDNAPRSNEERPPDLEEAIFYILQARGLHHLVEPLRAKLGQGDLAGV